MNPTIAKVELIIVKLLRRSLLRKPIDAKTALIKKHPVAYTNGLRLPIISPASLFWIVLPDIM